MTSNLCLIQNINPFNPQLNSPWQRTDLRSRLAHDVIIIKKKLRYLNTDPLANNAFNAKDDRSQCVTPSCPTCDLLPLLKPLKSNNLESFCHDY